MTFLVVLIWGAVLKMNGDLSWDAYLVAMSIAMGVDQLVYTIKGKAKA